MNIFFLSFIPALAAQMHGDLHLIKMILETAQLLSTAYRWLHGERPKSAPPALLHSDLWIATCTAQCGKAPYKMTHYNHGSAVWARECQANFIWLAHLGVELCREKMVRLPNNSAHVAEPLLNWYLANPPSNCLFPTNSWQYITVPYIAIADFWDCKIDTGDPYQSVLASYHRYYRAKQAVGIVYYKWLPERTPKWLIHEPPPTAERLAIISTQLNKEI